MTALNKELYDLIDKEASIMTETANGIGWHLMIILGEVLKTRICGFMILNYAH